MHVELCLDTSQLFYNLAVFSIDMYFRANVTNIGLNLSSPKKNTQKKTKNIVFRKNLNYNFSQNNQHFVQSIKKVFPSKRLKISHFANKT